MAAKTPIRAVKDGSGNITGFSEYQSGEFLSVAQGGTGAITATAARTALGVSIGSDIQAYDADLAAIAALSHEDSKFIVSDGTTWVTESGATARASLGLTIGTNVQAFDQQLSDVAGLTPSNGNVIIGDGTNFVTETGSTLRSSLGLAIGTDVQAYDADLVAIAGLTPTANHIIVGNGSAWTSTISPTFTNLTVTGNLDVQTEILNTQSTIIVIDDAFVKLNTGNAEVDAGIIVDTSDTDDARLFYDVSANRWVLGENQSYDEILTQSSTDTITNKTISGSSNTFTNIGNSALSNSSLSVTDGSNSTAIALGGTITFTGGSGVDISESSGTLTFTTDLSEITSDLNEAIDDRIGSGFVVGGDGVDVAYDDAANSFTLTADLSEITTDLNERIDDQVAALLVDSATSGIDINYDDANNQLTISSDLSEITTDLNERVDDRVDSLLTAGSNVSLTYDDAAGTLTIASTDTNTQLTTEEVQDIVGGMVDGGTETNVSVTYDDTSGKLNFVVDQLTSEQVQDIIGPMFASNTETLITVDYQDSDGTIDLVVDNDLANYDNTNSGFITATLTNEQVQDIVGAMFTSNTETNIAATYQDSDGTIDLVSTDTQLTTEEVQDIVGAMFSSNTETNVTATYQDSDGTIDLSTTAQLSTEEVQDIVGGMFSSNTETNIAVTYDDSDGTIDLVSTDTQLTAEQVQDIVGAMFSSNTETNITATYEDSDGTIDLVADLLTEEAVEDFVAGLIVGGTNVTATYDDAAGTLTLDATDTNTQLTQEQVEDFVGGMLDGTETFITVDYDDTNGNIDFVVPVKDEDNMSSDSASHLATQQSIKAYVDSQITAEDLDFQADSGGALAIDLDSETLTFTGGTGIDTSGSGNTVTFAIDSTVVTESSTDTLTNKTINLDDNTGIIEFQVTVANPGSGNKYYLDGELAANVQLIPGFTYRFIQTDNSNSGHPLRLSTTKNGTHGGGSAYTTGVTTPGSAGSTGYTQIVVDAATADKLYYYCSSHSGMGGDSVISVQGSSFVAGTGISISGETISSTITQYANSDVQSYLSGGTGVTLSGSGEFSIGQAVATSSNVTFADLAATGNVTITGNLDVNGTTTTLDTTNSTIADRLIELGTGTTGTPANDMGIVLERGSSDNAFIGWDESADKFIVGTGSFTGASTGDLTISTGTLLANIEGNVTGNVTGNADTATTLANARTIGGVSFDGSANINLPGVNTSGSQDTSGNAATATALATGRTIGMTGDVVWTSASFDGSGNVTGAAAIQSDAVETAMVNANVISGQSAYSGTVDTTNDFVLIYDHSTTSLKKIAVSDLNAASGAGTMTSFDIAGDSGSNQTVANANVLTIAGGTGIDTSVGGTDTLTVALNTEAVQDIVGAMFSGNTESNITVDYQDSDGTIDLSVTGGGSVSEAFKTISVSGQSDVVADGATDTLTFVAGSNITLTTDASGDSITIASADTNTQLTQEQVEDFAANVVVAGANITKTYDDAAGTLTLAATGGAANAFSTLAVSGQSNVVADAATDTLTLVAGTGMTLTTDASADSITFTSSGSGGGGTMPFTGFDGSTDNIVLSSAATGGALPVTLAGGSSDPINMTATTQTLTSYADDDGDTKVEVERTTDNDTVHIKAGGTDVITATSSGVTITNLTVSGTTTQANELKITDTLFELNADGGSLTTDAGMIVERGSTGDNAAFIWDESTDSWVAGTTATDGSSSSNLTYTEGDLKAKTQNQSDNSTKVATTAYVDTALGSLSSNSITDADSDTKIQVEESSDEDIIRADTAGQERVTIDNNVSMSARGGFFTHNATMHASETFTIASTEGTVAAGPLDVQGTVDVQGTLVVV